MTTIVFYAVCSLVIHHGSAHFYPETKLNRTESTRRLPTFKVVGLFLVNTYLLGAFIGLAVELSNRGIAHLSWANPASFGAWLLVVLQFVLVLFLADTNFYWVHRTAHSSRWLFKRYHREHHEARHPNVWHCQYQHPLDYAATTALPMLWIPLLPIPMSYEAYFTALVFCHFTNIGGHCGFEVTSRLIARLSLNGLAMWLDPERRHVARLFNLVSHHDLHHQRFRYNMSLYFTLWDTLCGTASHTAGLEILPASLRPAPPESSSSEFGSSDSQDAAANT